MTDEPAKTILFVDDEPAILSALRRLLRREGWNILTAGSGREGLAVLREHPVDLVVSDMRMPEMDGATFLKQVREAYPDTIRITLTGHADRESVSRAFEQADIYQVIAKPWDDGELKAVLREALELSERQDAEQRGLHHVVNELGTLPPLPRICLELRQALREMDESSAPTVALIIAREPAIAAKVLQIANSSFFGQRRQVGTISRAVVVVGLRALENLVLSTSIFQTYATDEIAGFGSDDFWRHSIGCGTIARLLEEQVSGDRERLEAAMLAGTLHDLGKLVFARFMRDRYVEAVSVAQRNQALLADIEQQTLGVTHMTLGGYLADWWSLPAPIGDAIRWHAKPDSARQDPHLAAVVHIADGLAHRIDIGASGNGRSPEIEPAACDTLGVDPDQLETISARVEAQIRDDGLLAF